MKTNESIEQMFRNLTSWIQLPKYQAERRLDLFFGLYLENILKNTMPKLFANDELHIIPEFPLQKNEGGNNESNNIDYVVFNKSKGYIHAIELKTDCNSIEETQITYYKKFKSLDVKKLIEFAKTPRNGKYKNKYKFLAEQVNEDYVKFKKGEVIYIVPNKVDKISEFKYITFADIVEKLKGTEQDDFLLAQFLGFLETQKKCK